MLQKLGSWCWRKFLSSLEYLTQRRSIILSLVAVDITNRCTVLIAGRWVTPPWLVQVWSTLKCVMEAKSMTSLLVEVEWIHFVVYDQDFWNTSIEAKSLHSLLKMTAAFARSLKYKCWAGRVASVIQNMNFSLQWCWRTCPAVSRGRDTEN